MTDQMLKYYTDLTGQHRSKVTFLGVSFLGFTQFLLLFPTADSINKYWLDTPLANYAFFSGILLIQLLLIIGILHHLASLIVFAAKRNKYEALCILAIRNHDKYNEKNVLLRFLDSRSHSLKFLSDVSAKIAMPALLAILFLTGYFTWFLGVRIIGSSDAGFFVLIGVGLTLEVGIIAWYHHELQKRMIYSNAMRYILRGTEEMNRAKIEKAVALYGRTLKPNWVGHWFEESGTHVGAKGWDEKGDRTD